MFSLIIAIIAIAIVIGLVALSQFYGGSAMSDAQAQAEATRVKNEEQQLLGAVDMFNADKGRWPDSLQELVSAGYLTTVPQGAKFDQARAVDLSLVAPAYAQAAEAGWSMPVAGTPVFVTDMRVPKEVCRKYNLITRGDDGVLKAPFIDQPAQCYGEDSYRIVVVKSGFSNSLAVAIAPQQVVLGGVPSKDTGNVWWDTLPSGDIKAGVDKDKVLYAELTLQPGAAESFGDVQVGQVKGSNARTVVNAGNITATGIQVSAPAGFNIAGNTCLASLNPGASCSFSVNFEPVGSGSKSGDVVVNSGNAGSPKFAVSGVGRTAAAGLSNIAFGNVASGAKLTRASTLRNQGVGPLTLSAPVVTGAGFALAGTTCGPTLAAGASCDIDVEMTASGTSGRSGELTIRAQEAGDLVAALTGQSEEARIALTPTSNSFGDVQVGQTATGPSATISNSGNVPLTGLSITAPAGYALANNTCSSALPAGESCSFGVNFTPTAAQAFDAALTVTSAVGSPSMALTGTGRSQSATLSDLNYGDVGAGSTTEGASTLKNTGVGPVSVTRPAAGSVVGTGFAFGSTDCPSILAAGESCVVKVNYTASGIAAAAGTLTVNTSAGQKTAALAGQSQEAVLAVSPTSRAFGAVQSGQTKTSSVHTLSNSGNIPASTVIITPPAGYTLTGTTCTATLAPGANCSFALVFAPVAAQAYNGTVTITSANAGNAPVAVTGVGQAASATLANWNAGNVAVGSNASMGLVVANTGVGPLTITPPTAASITGAGFSWQSTGTQCSGVLAAGSTCVVYAVFTPPGPGAFNGAASVNAGDAGTLNSVLTGTGQKAVLSHTTTAANFGTVYQGDTAYSSAYTVSNTGNIALTGLSINAPASYGITSNTCNTTLNAGSNCSFVISFTPASTGTFNGSVTLSSTNGGSGSISASGTGAARFSQATLTSASSITLADWYTSSTITGGFIYRNDGNQAMTLSSPSLSSPLSVTGNSCSNVSAGSSCTITVALTRNANSGGSGAQSFVASGATVAPAQVTVNWAIYSIISRWGGTSLAFGNVQTGQSSSKSITLFNDGSVTQNWASNNGMANVPAGFSFNLSGCTSVAPNGGSCSVSVTFTPPGVNPSYGGGSIYPTAASITGNLLSVSGAGVAPSATFTSSLAFGNISSGVTSDKAATLSNTGSGTIAVGAPTVSGAGFSIVGNTCSSSLAASTSCIITVRYTASGTSTGAGTLSVATDAGTKTASVSGQSVLTVVDAGGYYRYVDGSVASSCLDYRNGGTGRPAATTSGVYMVNMGGGNEQVYCEQSYNGGGWTLVARTGGYQSGGFGWSSAGGSIGDQSGSYSLGVLNKGLNFSQILFGDRSGNSVGSRAYINNVSKGTLAGASNSLLLVGAPSGPGSFNMAQYMGFTGQSSLFFFRDCCGIDSPYGLSSAGWSTAYGDGYNDVGGQAAGASYGGYLNGVQSGIIFVR